MTEPRKSGGFERMASLTRKLTWLSSSARRALLHSFFQDSSGADCLRAIRLILGDAPQRVITRSSLKAIHRRRSPYPDWLQDECHSIATDPCEAVALLEHHQGDTNSRTSLDDMCRWIEQQKVGKDKDAVLNDHWDRLSPEAILFFNRLITGEWRPGNWKQDLVLVLAKMSDNAPSTMAYRLQQMDLSTCEISALLHPGTVTHVHPHPFQTHGSLPDGPAASTEISQWSAYWLREGVPVQLVKRKGEVAIWTNAIELLPDINPELLAEAGHLPDGAVISGLAIFDPVPNRVARSGKKTKITDGPATPTFILECLDVLEWEGVVQDGRHHKDRLALLANWQAESTPRFLRVVDEINFKDRSELDQQHKRARAVGARGILLAQDTDGGKTHVWPATSLRIHAVLLYAQPADGRTVNQAQYSFALRSGADLVTIARTGEGLDPDDRSALDLFIKNNTLQRFGPVRTVKAEQVFCLAFDAVKESTRHKSGFILEGVRIQEWMKGASWENIGTMGDLRGMAEL